MDNDLLKRLEDIHGKEAPPENDCSEIERLIYGHQSAERELKLFRGLKVCWQDIRLPEDFDSLITFIAPTLREFDPIRLGFSDIVYRCALDVERKICKNGYLKIFEASCFGSVDPLAKTFGSMHLEKHCLGCLLILKGDYTLLDMYDIEVMLHAALGEDSRRFVTALHYDRTIPRYFTMQVIFRMAYSSFAK